MEQSTSLTYNTNHRMNLKFDWKINSKNSLIFQPKLSYQYNAGKSDINGLNKLVNNSLSSLSNLYKTHLSGSNILAPILYKHSFSKKEGHFLLISIRDIITIMAVASLIIILFNFRILYLKTQLVKLLIW